MSIARYGRLVVELADMANFIPLPAPVWLASVDLLGIMIGRKRLRRIALGLGTGILRSAGSTAGGPAGDFRHCGVIEQPLDTQDRSPRIEGPKSRR